MVWVDDHESLDPELREQRMKLRNETNAMLLEHQKDFPHWSMPGLGVNFSDDLFRALRRTGRHGPIWQHLRNPAEWAQPTR